MAVDGNPRSRVETKKPKIEAVQRYVRRSRGIGKALRPTVHPLRSDVPIWLGAEGPKNVALEYRVPRP